MWRVLWFCGMDKVDDGWIFGLGVSSVLSLKALGQEMLGYILFCLVCVGEEVSEACTSLVLAVIA